MKFQEVEQIVTNITCQRMRARSEKLDRKYFRIVVYCWNDDKDYEFTKESGLFNIVDDRIIPLEQLSRMDKYNVIETVRDMMLNIHLHEFNEFFKFEKETVHSPHLSPEESRGLS